MKIENAFNTRRIKATPKGAAGYDNPRENIDPHIKTQVVSTQEYFSRKSRITPEGAFCIKLTNKTGAVSVNGSLVEVNSAQDFSIKLTDANSFHPIGVIIEDGIADGDEVWICITGMVDILMDSGGSAAGDRLITSATPGSADVNNIPSATDHFKEIGHCLESRVGAGLARAIIHFL